MLKFFKFIGCFLERSERNYPRIFWLCTSLLGFCIFHEPVTTSSQSQIVIEQVRISRGGGSKSDSNSFVTSICLSKRKNFDLAFHRRLEQYFPDWKERIDYQKKQDPEVKPNIFDTRQSFLRNMHDPIAFENFLDRNN